MLIEIVNGSLLIDSRPTNNPIEIGQAILSNITHEKTQTIEESLRTLKDYINHNNLVYTLEREEIIKIIHRLNKKQFTVKDAIEKNKQNKESIYISQTSFYNCFKILLRAGIIKKALTINKLNNSYYIV